MDTHLKNQIPKSTSFNKFAILSQVDTTNVDHLTSTSKQAADATIKKQKIPPIVIDSLFEFKEVLDLIGTDGYFFRRTSMGTKIFSDSMDKYFSLLALLKQSDLKYHTHKIYDNSTFKMVLKGLHKVPTDWIKDELLTYHGVKCIDIKEIITSKSSQNDALYLLAFNRMEVNKKILFKIKYLQNISVIWKNQRTAPNRGPTQCKKCGIYGHGTENCFRQIVCFLCSSKSHDSTKCTMNNASGGIIYKCFNCVSKGFTDVSHKADDPNCACRLSYLEARRRATSKNSTNQRRNIELPIFNMNNNTFPILTKSDDPKFVNTNERSYANVFKQNKAAQNDLFSMDQLFTIFQNATLELKKCSSKLDQLNIIMNLLKYAV